MGTVETYSTTLKVQFNRGIVKHDFGTLDKMEPNKAQQVGTGNKSGEGKTSPTTKKDLPRMGLEPLG